MRYLYREGLGKGIRGMTLIEKIEKGRQAIAKARAEGRDTTKWEEYLKRLIDQAENNIPHWYTEEDRIAVGVLKGICCKCAYLHFASRENGDFKGLMCSILKAKLEIPVDSCPYFVSTKDEIDRLMKELGIEGN